MNKAEQLIACLEGEIAKRDARIEDLEMELSDTEERRATAAHNSSAFEDRMGDFQVENGKLSDLISDLRAELSAIKAQEPVAYAVVYDDTGIFVGGAIYSEYDHAFDEYMTHTAGDCSLVTLYAAPVSEAKAQGVVMPERWNVPRPMWKDARQPYGNPLNHADIEAAEKFNLALDEVARLNAAPVQRVSVPDGWRLVPIEATEEILDVLYSNGMDESDSLLQDIWSAMLAAAPAAPAADALYEAVTPDVVEWLRCGLAANNRLVDGTHPALERVREAIAAHRAKGVV